MAALQKIVDAYHARIASTCARVSNCRYDQGALQRLKLVPEDLSSDANHLSIQGHRKMAAVASPDRWPTRMSPRRDARRTARQDGRSPILARVAGVSRNLDRSCNPLLRMLQGRRGH